MEEVIQIKNTPLTLLHIESGAKMGNFAGFNMPIVFSSINEEHLNVRNNAGLFDVSHMGEFVISGPDAFENIQRLSCNDASKLEPGKAQYSAILNTKGGIIDDLLIYRLDENEYMFVVNGANIENDWKWIRSQIKGDCNIEDHSKNTGLIALQGPKAIHLLQKLTNINVAEIKYYNFKTGSVTGVNNVIISATGYTGSGGFEIYCSSDVTEQIWISLIEAGKEFNLLPVGLAARNTLRLEMGYCLHGNDIDENTNPLEAGLSWICKFDKDFIGKEALLRIKENGLSRKLAGFVMTERGIPRQGYTICDPEGNSIGKVTSGSYAPSLDMNIGLGYIPMEFTKPGNEIFVQIRNKLVAAKVTRLPFYKVPG